MGLTIKMIKNKNGKTGQGLGGLPLGLLTQQKVANQP